MISMFQQQPQQQPTTTITTTADAATTTTNANYVYGISEAASAAYGHLISENVRAQIGCMAILLATPSKRSRELCRVVT